MAMEKLGKLSYDVVQAFKKKKPTRFKSKTLAQKTGEKIGKKIHDVVQGRKKYKETKEWIRKRKESGKWASGSKKKKKKKNSTVAKKKMKMRVKRLEY